MGTVTVVIPCFNCELYLEEAIESALAQTYPKLRIVVIDDGSNDGSPQILHRFSDRIRVIRQENRGLAAARNRGIDETNGAYLAFLDADDRWHPRKVATQVSYLQDHPDLALVFCDREWIDSRGHRITAPPHRLPA